MNFLIVLLLVLLLVFSIRNVRKNLVTRPVFRLFKRVLPPLTQTEREAMEAGDVGWDAELFGGKPDWQKLHAIPKPELSLDEKEFIQNQVRVLCDMLDDHQIVQHDQDLSAEVWDYLKKEGFFSLIIPKSFGGREFSALANSTIVATIASRSLSAAVTVMVPNSLGPGELLMHYGTELQKQHWLPGLASGEEVPCFALTGPRAGSDAGAIPDAGVVCEGEFEGQQVLGIRLNFSKRYITLAPVATVVGLAFKLFDPDHLLGDKEAVGITCALIPASHPGVQIGNRHNPLNQAFMNGTVYGKDVFIPLDWIIGGVDFAGKGWRMLVECLSAGRGISLPAISSANGHLAARMTGAYAAIREQFGTAIGQFEGVQEALARIGGLTYVLEATRKMTAGALDLGASPAVITAIAKYQMTELSRQVNSDAMDIHAGRGIQLGPKNYLGQAYMGIPVAITVEGANILTRNLMIFGQAATRCHPYVLQEMEAAANEDAEQGLAQFDGLLLKHLKFSAFNAVTVLWLGLTGGRYGKSPLAGATSSYYKQLTRMSRALALCADLAMLVVGGKLKRREMLSARLGDVLSHLYMASAVLKHYEDDGHQQGDLPFVHYALCWHLHEIEKALYGFWQNFPNRSLAWLVKRLVFPWGRCYPPVSDASSKAVANSLLKPSVQRDRLTHLCFIGQHDEDPTGRVEKAFKAVYENRSLFEKIKNIQRVGEMPKNLTWQESLTWAIEQELLTEEEAEQLLRVEGLREAALAVDEFSQGGKRKDKHVLP